MVVRASPRRCSRQLARTARTDILALCGRDAVLERARTLRTEGHLQRALALAEQVVNAKSDDKEAIALNAEILEALAAAERSFIARNFYTGAARALRDALPDA